MFVLRFLYPCLGILLFAHVGVPQQSAQSSVPAYTPDGRLRFPADYREWVFLSSGLGMTYGPLAAANQPEHPTFDNVFVNPSAYAAFKRTGHWPDKSVFILEVRHSQSQGSINQGGHFQRDTVALEAEVRDTSAKAGAWTFYDFPSAASAVSGKPLPRSASCYSCHAKHGAVDNTFVQFYPVLYAVAQQKKTLNPSFQPLPSAQ